MPLRYIKIISRLENATGLPVGPAVYKTLGVDPIKGKLTAKCYSRAICKILLEYSSNERKSGSPMEILSCDG
uniref:Ribosomal_S7 domain-containing protein n=1 Tax=Heterorhabditis bacteriophora TaxID=37862 RepID=A0A1I7WKC7_HETBA